MVSDAYRELVEYIEKEVYQRWGQLLPTELALADTVLQMLRESLEEPIKIDYVKTMIRAGGLVFKVGKYKLIKSNDDND